MNVLITGASGFIGGALARHLTKLGHSVITLSRSKGCIREYSWSTLTFDSIGLLEQIDLSKYAIDCVVHAAGISELSVNTTPADKNAFFAANTEYTLILAKVAIKFQIPRFIFISSAKVNGIVSRADSPFSENDAFTSAEPYAISKHQAELGLQKLSEFSEMEFVIVRPPAVYGPNVNSNFRSLIQLTLKRVPLPFALVNNRRSFLALDNLVDFLCLCIDRSASPHAANEVFLISDGEDVSLTTLLQKIAVAYGKSLHLFPVPVFFIRLFLFALGKSHIQGSLLDNFQLNSTKASNLLSWRPVITMEEQLTKMAVLERSTK